MNNQRNHIMIRVTALDSRPSAAIAAIAAVAFNPETGTIADQMYCPVDIDSSQREGGTIDSGAFKYWLRQSAELRAELLPDVSLKLREALAKLNLFVLRQGEFGNCPVWFKRLDDDAPIIYSAMASTGIAPAWHYAHAHHVSTLLEFIPVVVHGGCITMCDSTPHSLLNDALRHSQLITSAWHALSAMNAAYLNSVPVPLAMTERP
ncbi:3'-5' exonuclease [Pantoea agglomerans]|uniref:3'-5' exonuclease n=1 Tax=Enterobacter agglomerans TaxID=549 RepID=UPI003DA10B83